MPTSSISPASEATCSEHPLVRRAPCGLFLTDGSGLVCGVSDTVLECLELGRADGVGRLRFQDMLTAAGRIYAETHLLPMLKKQRGFQEIAMTLRSPSGVERRLLATAAGRTEGDGSDGGRRVGDGGLRGLRRRASPALQARVGGHADGGAGGRGRP